MFIIYMGTTLVYREIIDDDQMEYPYTGAREVTVARDRMYLPISDYKGTLTAWTIPHVRCEYQLNHEEFVRGLAFSSEGHRIYHIRSCSCNIWESNTLIRPDESDLGIENGIRVPQLRPTQYIQNDAINKSQITTVTFMSETQIFCYGRDDNTVTIYDMFEGKKIR